MKDSLFFGQSICIPWFGSIDQSQIGKVGVTNTGVWGALWNRSEKSIVGVCYVGEVWRWGSGGVGSIRRPQNGSTGRGWFNDKNGNGSLLVIVLWNVDSLVCARNDFRSRVWLDDWCVGFIG